MKLMFAAHMRLPSRLAHTHQILQMCEAFAAEGASVTLLHAARRDPESNCDLWDWYGVNRSFAIEALPCIDWMPREETTARGLGQAWRRLAWYVSLLSFTLSLVRRLRREPEATVYSRDSLPLWALSRLWLSRAPCFFFEAHTWPATRVGKALRHHLAGRIGGTVVVTGHLRQRYQSLGFPPEKMLVAHDGVRAARFQIEGDRATWRASLGWPEEAFIVGYAGRFQTLGMDKGLALLARAVGELAGETGPPPVRLALVGGLEGDVAALQAALGEERIPPGMLIDAGWVRPVDLPGYLRAFDVCAAPFPWTNHFAYAASPLKLFEYMASGSSIVASDLPVIAEVLRHEHNALLVPAGDASALAGALRRLRDDRALGERLARQAALDVQRFTWEVRAQRILEVIGRAAL
jgi:glycosyltransferase involved in cell wall biosynthesis